MFVLFVWILLLQEKLVSLLGSLSFWAWRFCSVPHLHCFEQVDIVTESFPQRIEPPFIHSSFFFFFFLFFVSRGLKASPGSGYQRRRVPGEWKPGNCQLPHGKLSQSTLRTLIDRF
ncbi:hypothetical protein I7I50_11485 [Histoplasma capsulatum G186AR]|uniref:Uncharacterized protein n=1 Tax=Ajellomyces capsulatus TaxID=5037 RepID=A0A8H8D800_AJECA|nr:hypothetical protein I7I52_02722 [Histoplasma capsulatum]QSS69997.1 hypothetical protein I7I50_11485 [Histoplasma capsulatum G186AR]